MNIRQDDPKRLAAAIGHMMSAYLQRHFQSDHSHSTPVGMYADTAKAMRDAEAELAALLTRMLIGGVDQPEA